MSFGGEIVQIIAYFLYKYCIIVYAYSQRTFHSSHFNGFEEASQTGKQLHLALSVFHLLIQLSYHSDNWELLSSYPFSYNLSKVSCNNTDFSKSNDTKSLNMIFRAQQKIGQRNFSCRKHDHIINFSLPFEKMELSTM